MGRVVNTMHKEIDRIVINYKDRLYGSRSHKAKNIVDINKKLYDHEFADKEAL